MPSTLSVSKIKARIMTISSVLTGCLPPPLHCSELGAWKAVQAYADLPDRTPINIKDRWVSLRNAYEHGWRDERNKMPDSIKILVRQIMEKEMGTRVVPKKTPGPPPDDQIEESE